MNLEGKVTIVTGGVSGIGAAIAGRFAREGAIVIAADIAVSEGPLLPAQPIAPLHLDVSDPVSVAAAIDATQRLHGRIDCLVHAAGIGLDIPFLETGLEEFDRIIAVNLRGTFLVGQACARLMSIQGSGAIVNIASVSGMRGNVGRAAYGASKGGVVTLSQVMAVDLAAFGIRVNVIAPGPVDTPLVAAMHGQEIRERWIGVTPLSRYAQPAEIAGAAVFLCSDDASYVTGHVLAVDGGFLGAGLTRAARSKSIGT
ncbi:MAG: short-chain dehydrogenase [Acidiphilium sp. 37-64-53]|uniref:SDR family NAD(P)-dependent oxidoreductase n=1 Tax=unclassified Acidiphilium TaxID=2617493 RepID=UPI000BDD7D78|nr:MULTISPECIES: glucose 1-dehydrogenase [unclassified Acidiphilium]OYW00808.1 MAG: short-chain dehydrogenase [Acidiphilium sp. 37-64-53]OZB24673.1 MAG: short-chain dehydrogenase [Acidiphilium sp. 34-64-41]HQT89545.1 SDR family oxidoreductase [Acidiphilium sp.]